MSTTSRANTTGGKLPDLKSERYVLPSPSQEQYEIINAFSRGYNIRTQAVAGAGKTSSLLQLTKFSSEQWNMKTLLLTYNKDLKEEITVKARESGMAMYCDVYTYHGYASKIYQRSVHNDTILRECLATEPVVAPTHTVILLDEVQDMNSDYNKLACKVVRKDCLVVLVGDSRQCINEHLKASSEYLLNYQNYFSTGRSWKELSLRTSYRMTPAMAEFVNTHILHEDLIIPGNTKNKNYKPIYFYEVWNMKHLLKQMVDKYGPNEVVIIVPSIKCASNPKSPLGKLLANSNKDMLFCVRENDTVDTIMENKIVITSYNSMKGRERKCVIVMNFDESYFEFFDKKWSKEEKLLPNIIYVAVTRATEQLILVQDKQKPSFRTVITEDLPRTCKIKGYDDENKKISKSGDDRVRPVTDILKHRHIDYTLGLMSLVEVKNIIPAGQPLSYRNCVQFEGYYEDMSKFYGTLIPLYTEHKMLGTTHLTYMEPPEPKRGNNNIGLRDIYMRYNNLNCTVDKTLEQWMELVVMLTAINSKHHYHKEQISHYEWVDKQFIKDAANNIENTIPKGGTFEFSIDIYQHIEGIIDYLTNEEIWEFKCTSTLTNDHVLQCAAYISLYYIASGVLLPAKLFNARTGELLEITVKEPNKFMGFFMEEK